MILSLNPAANRFSNRQSEAAEKMLAIIVRAKRDKNSRPGAENAPCLRGGLGLRLGCANFPQSFSVLEASLQPSISFHTKNKTA